VLLDLVLSPPTVGEGGGPITILGLFLELAADGGVGWNSLMMVRSADPGGLVPL
jgi:hypothetical protein